MGIETTTEHLKEVLRTEVNQFCRRNHRAWKQPIVDTLRDLRRMNVQAVLFGGTLRSLLVSRMFHGRPGRPRDVDIVVSGVPIGTLKQHFGKIIARETRFGGLHLQRGDWQFDVWPLAQTWAFMRDAVAVPTFASLPSTTFFNLEAIAVDVWAPAGRSRTLYSADDQFFEGILSRTIEVNREENPFPDLCVVRALVLCAEIDFGVGPRLAGYIARHGKDLMAPRLEELQRKHYGRCRIDGATLRNWIKLILDMHTAKVLQPIRLPLSQQLCLWPEPIETPHIRLHAIREM